MKRLYVIEDQIHCEQVAKFSTEDEAKNEIRRLIQIPYDVKPNKCPCTNWQNCERIYEIIEYDNREIPWIEISRKEIVTISKNGVNLKSENVI